MAGLSYLYAYFNLYSVGGSNCPSMDDALVDIEACLGVLEFLSRKSFWNGRTPVQCLCQPVCLLPPLATKQ